MKLLSACIGFTLIFFLGVSSLAETGHGGGRDNGRLFPKPAFDAAEGQLPGKVALVEPTFMARVSGGAVTLKWQEVSDAQNYHLQVATDPNFKWLTVDEAMYKGTSFEVKNLESGKHYYWRVAAANQGKWVGSTKGFFSKSMFAAQ